MSPTNTFDNLIRQRAADLRAEAARHHVDWDERRSWWQGRVEGLYEQIQLWFKPLVDDGTVMSKKETVDLSEEQLGTYQSARLTLSLDRANLRIDPVGSIIIGGFGRLDVSGPAGRAMLILAASDDNLQMPERRMSARWYLVRSSNRTKLTELTEEVFKQLFADLMSLSR